MPPKRKPPDTDELFAECMSFAAKHLFKDKRTRADVAVRKQIAKETSCTVVKTTWNSFCKPEGKALAIESCLFHVNKAIAEAYLLANLHVLRMCETGKPIRELGQTFYYQCLSAISSGERNKTVIKDLEFRNSVEVYQSYRPVDYTPPQSAHLCSGWFQQASQQMAVAAKNGVSENFWRRFKRYLKSKYELGKNAWMSVRDIRAPVYDGDDETVLRYRAMLPPKPKYGNIEDFPELVMPLQHVFLRHFETSQQASELEGKKFQKQHRLFSMLPTKQGFECSHLKMCSNGLYGLLKRSGVESLPRDGKLFREVSDVFWRKLFNVEKFETATRKFAGEVLTDGKSVSIVLRKPRTPERTASPTPDVDAFEEVWGLDPGRREVFVASNDDGEVKRCSTKHYHDITGYKQSVKKIQRWQKRSTPISDALESLPRKRTGESESLRCYIETVLASLDLLLNFHIERGYRGLKFKRYIGRQRALRKLCDHITAKAGRNTLVGFGDWSNRDVAGIIKKSPAGPVKQLERELKKRCTVVSVDEFRTSKLHECCHQPLKVTRHTRQCKDGVVRNVQVRSVLFCANRSCNGMCVNRDVNASRNILALMRSQLLGGGRIGPFRRETQCGPCHSHLREVLSSAGPGTGVT